MISPNKKDEKNRMDGRNGSLMTTPEKSLETAEELNPCKVLWNSLVFGFLIPASVLVFAITRQLSISVLAALALPLIAIGQGALGIISYRIFFGTAPVPISPSHGVVQAISSKVYEDCQDESDSTDHHRLNKSLHEQQEPLRLLVLGDSLAIGVGQSTHFSPVLPEVVAKTLSKRFKGRTVFWTCHGQPGASTGWIVRELERAGMQNFVDQSNSDELDEEPFFPQSLLRSHSTIIKNANEYLSDTDDSTSDELTDETKISKDQQSENKNELSRLESHRLWKERLREHRNRFEKSEYLGPYDAVVVITGSNDLKSTFFPFLCKGEDADFRREAAERGGTYDDELKRLLNTLHSRLRNLQHRASSVRLSVLKSVQLTVERIIHRSPTSKAGVDNNFNLLRDDVDCHVSYNDPNMKNPNSSINRNSHSKDSGGSLNSFNSRTERIVNSLGCASFAGKHHQHLPLVVLPGLPARSVPIFHSNPLRWFAIPIFDILDTNKRKLADSAENNVLFVPSPPVLDLLNFENKMGKFWDQKCDEHTILALRDIRNRDAKRLEQELQAYYTSTSYDKIMTTLQQWQTYPIISIFSRMLAFLMSYAVPGNRRPGFSLYSIDSIHPNDQGYEFWGRYIADSIAERMLPTENEFG